MAAAEPTSVPVVIAGAGPAGLVAAVTLARHGVRSLLVERNPGPVPAAPGHRRQPPHHGAAGLLGPGGPGPGRAARPRLHHRLRHQHPRLARGGRAEGGVPGPRPGRRAQPDLARGRAPGPPRAVLLDHLRGLLATEVRFGTELAAFDQDADGVTVTLRECATGAERLVRAAYLVGADGAHSRVRAGLGIAMDGPGHLAEHLTVLFEAPLAGVVGDRRYGIYFIQHPEAGGLFVPNGARDRWLYGRTWDPARERLEDSPTPA